MDMIVFSPTPVLSLFAGHASGDASLAALAIATRKQGRIRHGELGAQPPRRWQCLSLYVVVQLLLVLLLFDRIAEEPIVRNTLGHFLWKRSSHKVKSSNLTARAEAGRDTMPNQNCLLQGADICQHESGGAHAG